MSHSMPRLLLFCLGLACGLCAFAAAVAAVLAWAQNEGAAALIDRSPLTAADHEWAEGEIDRLEGNGDDTTTRIQCSANKDACR